METKDLYPINYKGFYFREGTDPKAIEVIAQAYKDKTRLLFEFGDTETGKSWEEVNEIRGYIGRSTGNIKVPLLIHNSRSTGGTQILTQCILTIKESKGGKLLYSHPNFKAQ